METLITAGVAVVLILLTVEVNITAGVAVVLICIIRAMAIAHNIDVKTGKTAEVETDV